MGQKLSMKLMIGSALVMNSLSTFAGALHSAVTPKFEHPKKSTHFSYLATLINDSNDIAKNCRVEMGKDLPAKFTFWATKPHVDWQNGEVNLAVDVPPGKAQNFAFTTTFYGQLEKESRVIYPKFVCDNLAPAKKIAGINSLDFTDFGLEDVRWLTEGEVEALSERDVEHADRFLSLNDLNPEQAALISRLNPAQWSLGQGPLNTPLWLRGDNLGDINLEMLLANPEKATLQYLAALGPLTNVDLRTTIQIERVVHEKPGRDSFVSFTQVAKGVRSDQQPSFVRFTKDGTVVWIHSQVVRHDDLPELLIGAEEAMKRAEVAVKDRYELWFLCLAETEWISENGNLRKLFWFDRHHTKVMIGWEIRFLNTWPGISRRGAGIHTVLVDGANGETWLPGRPHPYFRPRD